MPADNISLEKIALVKDVLKASQERTFPYRLQILGLDIEVHKHVFPLDKYETTVWMTRNLPSMAGELVLEIGCGIGVTSLYVAKGHARHVLAADINPYAVVNTKVNAERNGIENIEVMESDIFCSISPERRFDTIYWHMPATLLPEEYEFENVLEQSVFDPGRRLLHRFLAQGATYLTRTGRLIIGFNVSNNPAFLEQALSMQGLTHTVLAQKRVTADGLIDLRLYEVRPG